MRLRRRKQWLGYVDDGPTCDRMDTTETFVCALPPRHAGPHSDPVLENTTHEPDWPTRIFSSSRVDPDQDLAGNYWLVHDSPDGTWRTKPMRPDARHILHEALLYVEGEDQ